MKGASAKTLALWVLSLAGWLSLSAALSLFDVPLAVLMLLNFGALVLVLCWIARKTVTRRAVEFLTPDIEGPSALTPYGAAAGWISGFGTVGIVAMLLMEGASAFVLVPAVIGAFGIVSILVAPVLADSGARALPDWFVSRFGTKDGGIARSMLALSGLAVLTVQMSFAGILVQAVGGLSPVITIPLVAILVLLMVMGGGFATAIPAQAALFVVLLVGVMVPALWLGFAQAGIAVPHVAAGALLHETSEARSRLGLDVAEEPFGAAMMGLTVLLGLVALPHTLVRWPMERSGIEARYFARRGIVMAVFVVAALPLFAIAVRADLYAVALVSGSDVQTFSNPMEAMAGAVAVLEPPGWLLATLVMGGLAAIVAASANATLLVIGALGGDPSAETAGGVLSRFRWTGGLVVLLSSLLALVWPVDPVTTFLTLLVLATASFFAPLMLALFWLGMTGAGAIGGLLVGGGVCIALMAMGWTLEDGVAPLSMLLSAATVVLVSVILPVNRLPKPPVSR